MFAFVSQRLCTVRPACAHISATPSRIHTSQQSFVSLSLFLCRFNCSSMFAKQNKQFKQVYNKQCLASSPYFPSKKCLLYVNIHMHTKAASIEEQHRET